MRHLRALKTTYTFGACSSYVSPSFFLTCSPLTLSFSSMSKYLPSISQSTSQFADFPTCPIRQSIIDDRLKLPPHIFSIMMVENQIMVPHRQRDLLRLLAQLVHIVYVCLAFGDNLHLTSWRSHAMVQRLAPQRSSDTPALRNATRLSSPARAGLEKVECGLVPAKPELIRSDCMCRPCEMGLILLLDQCRLGSIP
jgi:hypothetical protein